MLERKNRPKAISEKAKKLIIQYSLQNANEPRETIANILRREIKKLGERPPTLETLKKKISSARNRNPSPLDKPWHLHETLDMPAEAIAAIFEVQKWLEKERNKPGTGTVGIKEWTEFFTDNKMTTAVWPLTIREALWISRLYKVNYNLTDPEILYLKKHKLPILARRSLIENPYRLWEAAKTYADYQRLCELAGTDFDTSRLDEAIRSGSIGRTKYDLFSEYKSKKEGENNERTHNKTK